MAYNLRYNQEHAVQGRIARATDIRTGQISKVSAKKMKRSSGRIKSTLSCVETAMVPARLGSKMKASRAPECAHMHRILHKILGMDSEIHGPKFKKTILFNV